MVLKEKFGAVVMRCVVASLSLFVMAEGFAAPTYDPSVDQGVFIEEM